MHKRSSNLSLEDRVAGAIMGLFVGDALAMPVHWYYNRQALAADYGWVSDYKAPRPPHPDSILWRSFYIPSAPGLDILHDQAVYWGQSGIHYHQFLQAGENTLNLKLCHELIASLDQNGRYDQADFVQRYVRFMTTPGTHRDTYVEEYHRNWFNHYGAGKPPDKCGSEEKHISGIIGMVPIVLAYARRPEAGRLAALEHLELTHWGKRMRAAGTLLIDVLQAVLRGQALQTTLESLIGEQKNPLLGHPFKRWQQLPDDWVVGRAISTACYVEDAVPAVVHLALRYHHNGAGGLTTNTNLGGDNAGRGAVLGALLGAENGLDGFPKNWGEGLLVQPRPPQIITP